MKRLTMTAAAFAGAILASTVAFPQTAGPVARMDSPSGERRIAQADPGGDLSLDELLADELRGVTVVAANGKIVGKVSEAIVGDDQEVDAVIVDAGSFLGIGAKPVAIEFDALDLETNADGEMTLRVDVTEEQLEDAPTYQEGGPSEGQIVQ